jgi:hypothetical protein
MTIERLRSIRIRFEGKAEDELGLAIKRHIEAHGGVTLIDVVKFLYQSVLGSFHMLDHMNESEIEAWIRKSFAAVKPERRPLTEKLYGDQWVRLDLGAFKQKYGPNDKPLIGLFLKGKEEERVSTDEFSAGLDRLMKLVSAGKIRPLCSTENLPDIALGFFSEYKQMGFPPLHHSRLYSERNPEYVVIPRDSLAQL